MLLSLVVLLAAAADMESPSSCAVVETAGSVSICHSNFVLETLRLPAFVTKGVSSGEILSNFVIALALYPVLLYVSI
tara:strand:+ start:27 stop:257 length:231 start_codon:yes stop_codon:yes gene_type:complete